MYLMWVDILISIVGVFCDEESCTVRTIRVVEFAVEFAVECGVGFDVGSAAIPLLKDPHKFVALATTLSVALQKNVEK